MTSIQSPYSNWPTDARERLYCTISPDDHGLLFSRKTGLFLLHGARAAIIETLINKLADHVRTEHPDIFHLDPTDREERIRLILSRTAFGVASGAGHLNNV